MSTPVIPVLFQRGTAMLIFALGIFLVAAHALLATLVGGYLAIWLAAGLLVGDGTNFPLSRPELRRPVSIAVGFGPMLLAAALLLTSKTLRALNASMPNPTAI